MPFVPLDSFPRVSAEEQAARDAIAEQLVANEFQDDMPDSSRAALESEYRQRFGKEPSTTQRGFVPLAQQGFLPLDQETPSVLKTVLLENPATAIGEAALNLGSQAIALPVAGIAGLATEAGRALGFTDKSGADVVRQVGEKLTYEPRGEFGKAATDLATKPFQLLAEAGHAAGSKVLDATGSPASATAVDTAINALPMAIGPGIKGAKAVRERAVSPERVEPTAPPTVDNGFVALTDSVPDIPATTLVRQVVDSPALVQKKQRPLESLLILPLHDDRHVIVVERQWRFSAQSRTLALGEEDAADIRCEIPLSQDVMINAVADVEEYLVDLLDSHWTTPL